MTLHLNDAGTWRQIQNVYVNDAGTWREIQEVYVNDAGTWRSVFVNDVISIDNYDVTGTFPVGSGSETVSYLIANDGLIYINEGSGSSSIGAWITPQANMANYEVFATLDSGTLTSGTTGAWQNLSVSRSWTRASTTTATTVITIQIRRASDATVLDTATITLRILRT